MKEALKLRRPTLIWFIYLFFDLSRTFPSHRLYKVTTRPQQGTAFIGWPIKEPRRSAGKTNVRAPIWWDAGNSHLLTVNSSWLYRSVQVKRKLWTSPSVWHIWSILLIRAPPTQAAWLLRANPLNPSSYSPLSTTRGKSNFWLGLCSLELHNIYTTSTLASLTCWPQDLYLLSLNSDLRAIHPLNCLMPPCGCRRTDVPSLALR